MVGRPSYNFGQQVSISSDSLPQITIDRESMQVDSTQVTIDKSEDPFKDFGLAISSSLEEEEEKSQSQKRDEGVSTKKSMEEVKVTTPTSAHIATVTPSTPQNPTLTVPSNDEAEAQNLISSLSKLF